MEHDVVVEQKIILGTGDRCVPFARKVRELWIAFAVVGEEVLEFRCVRPGVNNLIGIDACNRIAGDIPRVVESGLNRAQTCFLQTLEDLRQVPQKHSTKLQVLAGGDVAAAQVSVAFNDRGDDS